MPEKRSRRHSKGQGRNVAVLWDPEGSWSISAIEGAAEFGKRQGGWRLLCAPRDRQLRIRLPRGWKGDGILARLLSRKDRERCLETGLPIVDLETIDSGRYHPRIGKVVTNDHVRGMLALEHLLERQVHQIVCFNPPYQEYSPLRVQVFQRLAHERGFDCPLFWTVSDQHWWKMGWDEQQVRITNWLKQLPPGTGIFTPDGRQGRVLTECCQVLEILVPDELAIVTGDDDSLLCSISSPPLSGVVLASRQHGYEAAALLHRMMEGEAAPTEPVLIDPLKLVIRQSTDVLKYDNPHVVQAMRFIRDYACTGINVDDVIQHVPISRRGLEDHFQKAVGQTLGWEIRRVRFERAKVELANTDLSISQVATACGFSGISQFCNSFRKEFGETPSSYRQRLRGG